MAKNDLSGPFVLLEDNRGEPAFRLYRGPVAILCARSPSDVSAVLDAADAARNSGHHVAGYLAYEAGYLLEPRLAGLFRQREQTPLVWLGLFERCESYAGQECEDLLAESGRAYAGPLAFEWNAEEYAVRFARVQAWIAAGDFYQANLTFRARFSFVGDPRALYRELRHHAGAAHCAYIDDGERQILSLSPELFFDIARNGRICTKPMKGTAARGATPAEDAMHRARLLASEKERAENLMIVDLMRNDLSRIAEVGSVFVENLFEIETYPTLHQMVSTVAARLKPDMRIRDFVRGLFPCGSVTGAPKIRAMEAIRSLETSPRGVYCGAIGAFAPDGSARFNVSIRTLTIASGKGELGVGGGIVYDSRSFAEYEESLLKAQYFQRARLPLELIETLRWSQSEGFVRAERHLARIQRSAATFGMLFDRGKALCELNGAVREAVLPLRVRLVLHEDGRSAATAEPLDAPHGDRWRFVFSSMHVQSGDALLRHKTNRRETFEAEHRRVTHALNADEVLFLNERGEITEGSRTNLFAEIGGELLTPALSCGLLDGCLRREMVEEGHCREAILRPEHLDSATGIFLGNSLRGLVPAWRISEEQAGVPRGSFRM